MLRNLACYRAPASFRRAWRCQRVRIDNVRTWQIRSCWICGVVHRQCDDILDQCLLDLQEFHGT